MKIVASTSASTVVASVALAAGLGFALPAHADPDPAPNNDAAFLAELGSVGITYNSAPQAVAAAQAVCGLMDNGVSGIDVLANVQKSNPAIGTDAASKFVAIAAKEYCPQHLKPT